jgi:hypothetical protein
MSKIRLFADDCVLYRNIVSCVDIDQIQKDLDSIQEWVTQNKMKLNIQKCKVMCFSNKKIKTSIQLQLMEETLETVDTYKYLGVVLHCRMNWKHHVEKVADKATKNLNFVMRNLRGTNRLVKEKAYLSLIRPIVEYAAAVWDPHIKQHTQIIEGVQRLAARRVTGKWRMWKWGREEHGCKQIVYESPTEMLKEFNWGTLENRRKEARLCNLYRAGTSNWKGWNEITEKIEEATFTGKNDHKYKIKTYTSKKDVGKFSFFNRTSSDWNDLSPSTFKQWPKTAKDFKSKLISN